MKLLSHTFGVCAVALAGLSALGCSSSGDDSDGGVSNGAISDTLDTLENNFRAGGTNLSTGITSGTIANPEASLVNGVTNIVNGAASEDGTYAAVDVTINDARTSDGSGTITVLVDEDGSSHTFVDATITYDSPSIWFRDLPDGYDALVAGVGQAFVAVRIEQAAIITRTLANTSTTTDTLIAGATTSDGTITAGAIFLRDYTIEYDITVDVNGDFVAEIVDIVPSFNAVSTERTGGPQVVQVGHTYNALNVGGISFEGQQDVSIPVGTDLVTLNPITSSSPFGVAFIVSGGVAGEGYSTDITGNVDATVSDDANAGISFSANLNGISDVNDTDVQIDADVTISTSSSESIGTPIVHSADANLGYFGSMEELIYLPSDSSITRVLLLFH